MSIELMRDVKYFDGSLWYQITNKNSRKLVNNKGNFKSFIVFDVTKEEMYSKDEFFDKQFDHQPEPDEVFKVLDSLKFKVFKKVKLKL